MSNFDQYPVPFVKITQSNVNIDALPQGENVIKIAIPGNNGRKILTTTIMHEKGEEIITNTEWKAPMIFPTGDGGIEVATFTEYSNQDRHKHLKGTEIYIVLRGELKIHINDKIEPETLYLGDEIIIFPGTIHEVVKPTIKENIENTKGFNLLVRVHSISCYGEDDKYVQMDKNG